MESLFVPDSDQVRRWLNEGSTTNYICEHCDGLHLTDLQQLDGVLDSWIFVEADHLVLTTEVELRPTALLPLTIEMGRINMAFPHLKVFVEVSDEALPKLIMMDTLHTRAGVSFSQFRHFLLNVMEYTRQLVSDCQNMGVITYPEGPDSDDEESEGSYLH